MAALRYSELNKQRRANVKTMFGSAQMGWATSVVTGSVIFTLMAYQAVQVLCVFSQLLNNMDG